MSTLTGLNWVGSLSGHKRERLDLSSDDLPAVRLERRFEGRLGLYWSVYIDGERVGGGKQLHEVLGKDGLYLLLSGQRDAVNVPKRVWWRKRFLSWFSATLEVTWTTHGKTVCAGM